MMARAAVAVTALVAVFGTAGLAAQAARNPGPRHQQLQEQVFRRFMDVATTRLDLEDDQREGLDRLLRDGQRRRQGLQGEMMQARRELARLARSGGDGEAVTRQLEVVESLRRREFELWRSEQEALRALLTPQQHAEFLMLQMQLNDRIRDLQQRRGRPGGPPPGSGGPGPEGAAGFGPPR